MTSNSSAALVVARSFLGHQEMERLQSTSSSKQSSFSLAELAQSKSGYLIYKSSRRGESASYVIAFLTIVLVVLTIALVVKG
jgi:hypothetical protein